MSRAQSNGIGLCRSGVLWKDSVSEKLVSNKLSIPHVPTRLPLAFRKFSGSASDLTVPVQDLLIKACRRMWKNIHTVLNRGLVHLIATSTATNMYLPSAGKKSPKHNATHQLGAFRACWLFKSPAPALVVTCILSSHCSGAAGSTNGGAVKTSRIVGCSSSGSNPMDA
eukprot:4494080-Pleurochrysis_carterae.AAC.1